MDSDQDRRALLAIMLSLGVYLLWTSFFAPPPPVVTEDPAVVATEQVETPVEQVVEEHSVVAAAPPTELAPEKTIEFGDEGWFGEIHSTNGALRGATLRGYTEAPVTTPIWSQLLGKVLGSDDEDAGEKEWEAYAGGEEALHLLSQEGLLGLVGSGPLDDDGAADAEGPSVYTVTESDGVVTASRTRPEGLVVQKRFTPSENVYLFDLEVSVSNPTTAASGPLWFGVADHMSGDAGRFTSAPRPQSHVDGSVEHVYDLEDLDGEGQERFAGPVDWVGVGDRYFMAVLVPEKPLMGEVVADRLPSGRVGSFLQLDEGLAAGDSRSFRFQVYVGPKRLDLLEPMGHELEKSVEYGWFGFFSKILLFFLQLFYAGVKNWGLAILLLTLMVKAAFFPLTQKAYSSSKRMQAIQPLLKEVKEKYADNRELQTQHTMSLFKEHGVNPMGGCLPTLIQLPVWFALYNVMLYSVELYDASFLFWHDLTAVDPYGVIPTMYAILMFMQQRMMPMGSMDPAQQRIIKMMPLIFSFFMFSFPSGLVLYFSANMMLTIGQQWFINRSFDKNQLAPAQSA